MLWTQAAALAAYNMSGLKSDESLVTSMVKMKQIWIEGGHGPPVSMVYLLIRSKVL